MAQCSVSLPQRIWVFKRCSGVCLCFVVCQSILNKNVKHMCLFWQLVWQLYLWEGIYLKEPLFISFAPLCTSFIVVVTQMWLGKGFFMNIPIWSVCGVSTTFRFYNFSTYFVKIWHNFNLIDLIGWMSFYQDYKLSEKLPLKKIVPEFLTFNRT